jgi:hypothetical protein
VNVSLPATPRVPRPLDDEERAVVARVADTLIPASRGAPGASAEPGFWGALAVALDARADAFADITTALAQLDSTGMEDLWNELQALDADRPSVFQALSTVIAGAWLLTPGVRDRIGYHGQRADKAGIEEAADEISSGVLDPVIEREHDKETTWIC